MTLFGNNFTKATIKIREAVLNLFFPKRCIECQSYGSFLCDSCLGKLKVPANSECHNCRLSSQNGKLCDQCAGKSFLDFLWIMGDYDDQIIKDIICKIKYEYIEELSYALDKLIKDFFVEVQYFKNSLFVPVPLHRRRLLERGFNQAQLISERVSQIIGGVIDVNLLVRIKYNAPQAKLSAKERRANLAGFFKINTERSEFYDKKRPIILVDDVYTTGTTMQECAKLLKNEGFESVGGIVIARGKWG
ncbi:MAG: ComF family protein [Candidatus Buchananbacteria bacterium]